MSMPRAGRKPYSSRILVEDCRVIDATHWMRQHVIAAGSIGLSGWFRNAARCRHSRRALRTLHQAGAASCARYLLPSERGQTGGTRYRPANDLPLSGRRTLVVHVPAPAQGTALRPARAEVVFAPERAAVRLPGLLRSQLSKPPAKREGASLQEGLSDP